jgi:hypothetical protein
LGFSLLEVQEKEETILERQVLKVVRIMSSSYIKDLGKLMDKIIACILFFATLELNIVDKEKKTRCDSCGTTDQSVEDQSFPNANRHLLPK